MTKAAQVKLPIIASLDGIEGCWQNGKIDTWCFYADGKGEYIQYSVNNQPGTLTTSFDYTVDMSAKTIQSRQTFIKLEGSCCDKAETVDGKLESASFDVVDDRLILGSREYTYVGDKP